MYLQGFSSSMPADVQLDMLHSIEGFEQAVVMRTAYAIEYDCIDSTQLDASLSFKEIPGLYGAGQFNGTSGYEEAAAQGLIAGMNAALYVKGKPPVILTRDSSYIGTLIDDLVTKGTNEPYRMMTSRSEYRLLLRQDNADSRLSAIGHSAGLLSDAAYGRYLKKAALIKAEKERLMKTVVPPSETINSILASVGEPPIKTGVRISDLLRRPGITYEMLALVDEERKPLPANVVFTVQTELKYEGYIKKQLAEAARFEKLEKSCFPLTSIIKKSPDFPQRLCKAHASPAAFHRSGLTDQRGQSGRYLRFAHLSRPQKKRRRTGDLSWINKTSTLCVNERFPQITY